MYIFVYMSVFFFFFTGTLIIGFCDTLIWKKIRRNEREWPTPNFFFVFSHLYFVSWDIFLKFLIFFSGCYCSRDKRVIERYYHTVYRWFFNSSGLADGNIIKEKVNRADGLSLHSSLFFFFFFWSHKLDVQRRWKLKKKDNISFVSFRVSNGWKSHSRVSFFIFFNDHRARIWKPMPV
jgi:hypothetical protein